MVTRFGHDTQSCMDPNILESKVLVSACGYIAKIISLNLINFELCSHDGPFGASGVKRLQSLGLVNKLPGMGALVGIQLKVYSLPFNILSI